MISLDIDRAEIEQRKQLRRDLWDYKPVDHIPINLWLMPYCSSKMQPQGYTIREMFEDAEIHFKVNVERIQRSLRLIPDDYIPFARMVLGYMTTATTFGVGVHWSDDPNQPPGSAGPIIEDLEQVYSLEPPSLEQGLVPELLRRLRYHAAHLPPDVYLTGINVGGPLQLCSDLVETNVLYTGFYDNPTALHHLLDLCTGVLSELLYAVVDAAGGSKRMTCIDWDPVWAPEPYKGHICDDVCSMIAPRSFGEFGLPYNNRLFQPWGSGLLHNCGPHPAKQLYMEHNPRLKGINCSYHYSREEFPAMREIFAGSALIEVSFDFGETAEEMLDGFRYTMESLAPDTVAIPLCLIPETWSDEEVTGFYWEMRKIGQVYAENMRWREDCS
jgi:hypothetical protein